MRSLALAKYRMFIQGIASLLSNIQVPNFFTGEIYRGPSKVACVPGLNCYSCPGAIGSCPIGALQATIGSSKFNLAYYITGTIILFGVLFGRFICGFLCPFGWFQDLLHKIPSKKLSTKTLYALRYVKYIILAVFVLLLPLVLVNEVGLSNPYFCKLICPQGILQGAIPLSIVNPNIRATLGPLFTWKAIILLICIVLSICFFRPFCKWICPLGALYSLCNRISLLQLKINPNTCINCGKCAQSCKMDVDVRKNQNHPECIRCGMCITACPTKSLSYSYGFKNSLTTKEKHYEH